MHMTALNVILSDDGAFEILSPTPGKRDFRILHDESLESHSWKVLSELGQSGVWREEDTFESLDEALDWAVSLSTETYPAPGYGVTLPCGTFLARPGRVKIEDAMAAIGWTYVISVNGWSPITYPKGTSRSTVTSYFEDLIEDTAAILGSVDLCPGTEGEDDDGMEMWIADVTIPVAEFLHEDTRLEAFIEIFDAEGIPNTNLFDYVNRVNVIPHKADVLDFEEFRKARENERADAKLNSAEACG